jgi:hypothetical protein
MSKDSDTEHVLIPVGTVLISLCCSVYFVFRLTITVQLERPNSKHKKVIIFEVKLFNGNLTKTNNLKNI